MSSARWRRDWLLWIIIILALVVIALNVVTYRTQHSHYQDVQRRADSKVIAQVLQGLFRDQPKIMDSWNDVFVLGERSGEIYCPALAKTVPIASLKTTLAPYIRELPSDPGIDITDVSLYYLYRDTNQWFVGNCSLSANETEEVK